MMKIIALLLAVFTGAAIKMESENGKQPQLKMKVHWFKCVRKPTTNRLSLTHHVNKSSR